jgi:N12 class adenine-specific DNA methylase
VPTDIIDDFITHLLGEVIQNLSQTASATKHDEETGIWEIPFKSRYRTTRFAGRSVTTYGTRRLEALNIIEKTLNQKTIAIYDDDYAPFTHKKIRKLNQAETLLAIEKQKLIIKSFQDWVWLDPKRKQRLHETYENRYSSNKVRRFDGSFLRCPGLNPDIKLYPYQKNAIARILFFIAYSLPFRFSAASGAVSQQGSPADRLHPASVPCAAGAPAFAAPGGA